MKRLLKVKDDLHFKINTEFHLPIGVDDADNIVYIELKDNKKVITINSKPGNGLHTTINQIFALTAMQIPKKYKFAFIDCDAIEANSLLYNWIEPFSLMCSSIDSAVIINSLQALLKVAEKRAEQKANKGHSDTMLCVIHNLSRFEEDVFQSCMDILNKLVNLDANMYFILTNSRGDVNYTIDSSYIGARLTTQMKHREEDDGFYIQASSEETPETPIAEVLGVLPEDFKDIARLYADTSSGFMYQRI